MDDSIRHQLIGLVNHLDISVVVIDHDLAVQWSNEISERMLGGSSRSGEPYDRTFPILQRELIRHALEAVGKDGRPRTVTFTVEQSDCVKSERLSVRIQAWAGGFMFLTRDEGAVVEKEAELIDAKGRFLLAAQESRDYYFEHDLTTDRLTWSESAGGFFGIPDHDLLDVTWEWWVEHTIHPDDRERVEQRIRENLSAPSTGWTVEFRARRANGTYTVVSSRLIAMFKGPSGMPRLIGAMTDLSDLKDAEAAVRRVEAELVDVSGQRAMEAMASTLAHEINQPLAAAFNYLGAANRLAGGSEADQELLLEALTAARSSLEKSGSIVRQIRSVVQRHETAAGLVEVRGLIEDASAYVLTKGIGRGVDLGIDVARDMVIRGDRLQMQQVFVNLIRNSLMTLTGVAEGRLRITGLQDGDRLRISFSDSGATERGHKTADPVDAADYMGMSLIRTIVEAHRGRVRSAMTEAGNYVELEFPLAA